MQPAQAGHMLEQARWAARSFATYDAASVRRIVEAVAAAAHAKAEEYAEWAVRETGMGVVGDKVLKNRACSTGLLDFYAGQDFVSPRWDGSRKIAELPRPAGVVLAVTPTTNPVASVYFKVLLSLMTRNAVVVAPHPRAQECCADAARTLARAAVEAGAPAGVIQVVDEPSIPLMEALMTDERTDVIVATGGTAVVRAAYSSGNPALGVGPGNVPVLVDATADLRAAAERIVASKAFDNSVLCTNESVLVVEEAVADALQRELERAGAYVLDAENAARLRGYMFFNGHLNTDVVGKDASWIAEKAGFRVGPRTRALVVPFDHVLPEEPMTHEKLSPVLGMVHAADAQRGIDAARAVVRIGGAGHSAAVHSEDPRTIMDFAARVPVLRVSVNVGNSTGSSGLETNLAPSMTLGTGFVGRSSVGENLEPRHLVNWSRIAYNADDSVPMPSFAGLDPWRAPRGAVPAYPVPSNSGHGAASGLAEAVTSAVDSRLGAGGTDRFRDEIRRLVLEELAHLTSVTSREG
jgi:acyl-CoA reductase-like NAD-dependent aldehyde dehydrogenase